ncbi:MAG TPA: MgtC/SapB family protein [Gaiellaceae bacterium]|nr:MgtC/SapB family protein [Gaiellaceae bacterium]
MPELSTAEVVLRLVVAAVLGGAIGVERELREREAGLRTHLLVSVGAALFTLVSAYAFTDFRYGLESGITLDPTRIAAQIVTGIGFLGAGAIIRQGLSIRGLTTAAGVWAVAAIGMAAGAGYYVAAFVTTAVVLVGLGPLRPLERALIARVRREGGVLEIELRPGEPLTPVLRALEAERARVTRLELDDDEERRLLRFDLDVTDETLRRTVVERVAALEGVRRVSAE